MTTSAYVTDISIGQTDALVCEKHFLQTRGSYGYLAKEKMIRSHQGAVWPGGYA